MSIERACGGYRGLVCGRRDCERCGWNPEVEAERIARIRAGEMSKNVYGLDYYPVPRGGDESGVETENAN